VKTSYGLGDLPVPAGADAYPCGRCRRVFVSDRSHLAERGFCMMCRPFVMVTCRYCAESCPGRYDGDACCPTHRAMPAEELQRMFPDAPPALVPP
jgi:hypothetical protein